MGAPLGRCVACRQSQTYARADAALCQRKDDIVDWAKAGGTREQLAVLFDQAQEWKPLLLNLMMRPANQAKKKKRKRKRAKMSCSMRSRKRKVLIRQRKAAAEELEVTAKAIDDEVRTRRDPQVAPLYGHWVTPPWPEPVDGDSLRDIIRRFNRHIVWSHHDALGTALWIMFAWVHDDVAVHSPMLLVTSAAIYSGKTTVLDLAALLMPRCLSTADISNAALYRSIQLWEPSFCIDEFDDVLANEKKTELRSVINMGRTRGQVIIRCVEPDYRPQPFKTFAPKAIGMVGKKMPASTLSRCIIIELRRKKDGEPRDDFEHIDDAELTDLRSRLRRWSMDNADVLHDAKPSIPKEFDNRRRNNWKVQFAIADLCGLDWGDKARECAAILEGGSDIRPESVRALAACKTQLDQQLEKGEKAIGSEDLCQKMAADETSEWAEYRTKSRSAKRNWRLS